MSRLLKYFASEFFRVSFERRKIGKSTNWKRKGSLWKNNPITETACSFMRPEPVALPCVFSFAQQIRCAAPLLKKKKKKKNNAVPSLPSPRPSLPTKFTEAAPTLVGLRGERGRSFNGAFGTDKVAHREGRVGVSARGRDTRENWHSDFRTVG